MSEVGRTFWKNGLELFEALAPAPAQGRDEIDDTARFGRARQDAVHRDP